MRCVKCQIDEKLKDPVFRQKYERYEFFAKISLAIERRREQLGLTKSELVRRAGVSHGAFSNIENCRNYTIDTLSKVLSALGMELVLTVRKG